MSDSLFLVSAGLLGACVGSFLNVVVYRVPRGGFFAFGSRSICPSCKASIAWFDNLPVLSWLLLRGRARCCRAPIGWRYPAIELLTAAIFVALAAWPPSGMPLMVMSWSGVAIAAFLLHAYFASMLVANTFIDFEHRILPDVLTLPAIAVGVIGSLVLPRAYGSLNLGPTVSPDVSTLLWSATGAATGFAVTWMIRAGGRAVFRKEAMGFGDVKFMAAIGAFVGPANTLLTFFLGSLLGAFGGVAHRLITGDAYVPFGPFLAGGALLSLFFGTSIQHFLLETMPEWQRQHMANPAMLIVIGILCLALMIVLVRRGRTL